MVCTLSYTILFCPLRFMTWVLHSWAIYPSQINQVYNLQYRPQTWVVRDIICTFVGIVAWVIPESCILCTLSSKEGFFLYLLIFILQFCVNSKFLKDAAEKRKRKRKPPQKLFDADAIRLIFVSYKLFI